MHALEAWHYVVRNAEKLLCSHWVNMETTSEEHKALIADWCWRKFKPVELKPPSELDQPSWKPKDG